MSSDQAPTDANGESLAKRIARFAPWKVALLVLMFLMGCFDLENADIWWHLRTGELILERGEIPQTDWFTYTNPESEWIDLHWLFQIVAAKLWAMGGSAALILAKCAIATLTIWIAMLIGRRGWSETVTVGCWLLPVFIFAGRYFVRPEILTLFYLTCTMAILWRARTNYRWIWLLPLLQVFWVNSQGLFVLQFVLIGAFGLEQLLRRASVKIDRACQTRNDEKLLPLVPMIIAGVVTLAASLLNPYGIRGAIFPATLFGRVSGPDREFFLQFSDEFMSMRMFIEQYGIAGVFAESTTAFLFALTLVTVISFLVLLTERRISIYRLLLFVGFAYLGWKMNRNAVLYAMVAGTILRLNVGQWWDLQIASKKNQRKKSKSSDDIPITETLAKYKRPYQIGLAIMIAGLIISIPTGLYHELRPSIFRRQFGFGENQWYPHAGAKFLENPDLPDRVYANNLGVAAVAIYHLTPEKKVFADARLETNSKEVLQAYNDILKLIASNQDFESLLRAEFRKGFDADQERKLEMPAIFLDSKTLVFTPTIFDNLTKKRGWRCVFFDQENGDAVFITEAHAREKQIPAADTQSLEEYLSRDNSQR